MSITIRFTADLATRLAAVRERAVPSALEACAEKVATTALERLPECIHAYHASAAVDAPKFPALRKHRA